MRIQYMRELIAIKEQGNYSRAAKKLYVTQPALSRHIADMEKELGIKILNRSKHKVEFTDMGMKVYLRFQRIVQNYDILLQDVADFKTGITGTLRLGILYYTIKQDFSSVLSRFSNQYPNVKFKRYYYQPHEVFHALSEDRIDIGVLPYSSSADSADLRFQNFYQDGMEVMMAASHPLASKGNIVLDDLTGEECIFLKDDPITNQCYKEALERCNFTAQKMLMVGDLDSVPYVLQKTRAVYIKAKGFSFPGYDREITAKAIEAKNLYASKVYAYRTDNPNPLIPLFLELVK